MPDHQPQHWELPKAELAIGQAPISEIVQAELIEPSQQTRRPVRRRRVVLPLVLFALTCASTFFAGATQNVSLDNAIGDFDFLGPYFLLPLRIAILEHWRDGVVYMACVLAILLTHEMGHFVMTIIYRVRSSLPYFIPMPLTPIGTMGAVILMDGSRADRKQIFDIGLAGPLAGLIVAVPVVWIGVQRLDLANVPPEGMRYGLPLVMQLLVEHLHPGALKAGAAVAQNQLNPFFMAGWVGLLVTGLNMMPVSQLDGGHVTYALFGRGAHWLARLFMLAVFVYMGAMFWLFNSPPMWLLMAILVLVMGTDHPPTRDDSVRLGWLRIAIGVLSLLIPVFCFAPNPFR